MNYIIIFNNTITLLSFAVNIFFLIPFIYKVYKYFTQKRYIKKLLAYNKEPVQIYQATYMFDTIDGSTSGFITYDYLKCIDNILSVFNIINQKVSFISQIDNARNEICVGGFIPNKRVNAYFVKYFKKFKYYVDEKYKSDYEKLPIDTQICYFSKNKTGFKIGESIFLETLSDKIDYAFLIKLTQDDFENGCNKTVHILFGGKSISTIKATEYLRTQYKEIYKKYKNEHYFFALEINLIDNSFNHKKGIIDLTNEIFP